MKDPRVLLFTFIILNSTFQISNAQTGEWTWIFGDSTPNGLGNYGIQGVPSSLNEPAPRYACGYWTDTAGSFWVYSGLNAPDDLWKFDLQTMQWTWMTGDSSFYAIEVIDTPVIGAYDPLNSPGPLAFGMLTWVTPDNHLWLFGGLYNNNAESNVVTDDNLWQYNPIINQWAWMGDFGPANYGTMGVGNTTTKPGGRQEGNCTWTDRSGNLWLFGGCDENYESYNDIWKYNVSTGIWTWMSGTSNPDDPGDYYIVGQPSIYNYPSARSTNFFWKDTTGNFWLAGGTQYDQDLMFQDVWKFNPQTLQWTWVSGPEGDDLRSNGVNCIASIQNQAGPRYENRATWKICEDLIITYNGFSDWHTAIPTNDLWAYKLSSNEWIKINSWSYYGDYGTMGVASPANSPPSRFGGVGFKGKDNSLWLFGGQADTDVFFNDLWRYAVDTSCVSCSLVNCHLTVPVITAPDTIFCNGDSAQVCVPSGYASYQWNNGATGNCPFVSEAGLYNVIVSDSNGCTAVSDSVHMYVYSEPGFIMIVQGDTVATFGYASYQWYFNDSIIPGATSPIYVAHRSGDYEVQVVGFDGCPDGGSVPIIIAGVSQEDESNLISIYPNPSVTNWQLSVGGDLLGSGLEIFDDNGRVVFQSKINNLKSKIDLDVAKGVYWLRISSANVSIVRKLVRL